jgi:glucose/arabinose dehydrogenase
VRTGAFVPFVTETKPGQVIKDSVECSGCIINAKLNGPDLKLVAWSLRNPYGLAFSEDAKKLYVANNGADERGSRPITNDTDNIYEIDPPQPAKFYGWPDFF